MIATVFTTLQTVTADAVTLVASLLVLGVTVLGWQLGSRWIKGITLDPDDPENYHDLDWYRENDIDSYDIIASRLDVHDPEDDF